MTVVTNYFSGIPQKPAICIIISLMNGTSKCKQWGIEQIKQYKSNLLRHTWYWEASRCCSGNWFFRPVLLIKRTLTAQSGCHLQAPHARFARWLPSSIFSLLPLPTVFSLYRWSFRVVRTAIVQSRVRMTHRWSRRLTASKRNITSVLHCAHKNRWPDQRHFTRAFVFVSRSRIHSLERNECKAQSSKNKI